MTNFDELNKMRPLIVKMLKHVTKGEISDFDFIIDYLSHNRGDPKVTMLFAISAKVKKQYDGDTDKIIMNHLDNINDVISTAGFPELTKRSIRFEVL